MTLKERIAECHKIADKLCEKPSEITCIWFTFHDVDEQELRDYCEEENRILITTPQGLNGQVHRKGSCNCTIFAYSDNSSKKAQETSKQDLDDLYKDDGKADDRYHR